MLEASKVDESFGNDDSAKMLQVELRGEVFGRKPEDVFIFI
jgi:hypothetical protein